GSPNRSSNFFKGSSSAFCSGADGAFGGVGSEAGTSGEGKGDVGTWPVGGRPFGWSGGVRSCWIGCLPPGGRVAESFDGWDSAWGLVDELETELGVAEIDGGLRE
ncbi:MAG: hypothetical protein ACK56Q_06195, partial [Pirellulaceae bacterium]